MSSLEGRLLDLRHLVRGPIDPPVDYVIVAIDDKTLMRLKRFPPPRAAIAACVERLTDAGTSVVAVDLLLLEREGASDSDTLSAGDAALSRAVERNGRVVLATALTPDVAAAAPSSDEELIRRNAVSI